MLWPGRALLVVIVAVVVHGGGSSLVVWCVRVPPVVAVFRQAVGDSRGSLGGGAGFAAGQDSELRASDVRRE